MTQVLTLCEGAPSCFNKILSMKVAVMKIVWRNPNHINSTSCVIEKICGAGEQVASVLSQLSRAGGTRNAV